MASKKKIISILVVVVVSFSFLTLAAIYILWIAVGLDDCQRSIGWAQDDSKALRAMLRRSMEGVSEDRLRLIAAEAEHAGAIVKQYDAVIEIQDVSFEIENGFVVRVCSREYSPCDNEKHRVDAEIQRIDIGAEDQHKSAP